MPTISSTVTDAIALLSAADKDALRAACVWRASGLQDRDPQNGPPGPIGSVDLFTVASPTADGTPPTPYQVRKLAGIVANHLAGTVPATIVAGAAVWPTDADPYAVPTDTALHAAATADAQMPIGVRRYYPFFPGAGMPAALDALSAGDKSTLQAICFRVSTSKETPADVSDAVFLTYFRPVTAAEPLTDAVRSMAGLIALHLAGVQRVPCDPQNPPTGAP